MKIKIDNFYKTLFFGLILIIIIPLKSSAQSKNSSDVEWKKKYNFSQTKMNFTEPPMFYAPHAFWFWDTALNPEQTASMAKEMTRQRLNPGYAHPRNSEAPITAFPALPKEEWLSPLWFESITTAANEAKKAGMTLGYCDEYMWPSANGDGRVLKQAPELVAKSLLWKRTLLTGGKLVDFPESKVTVAGQLSNDNSLLSNSLKVIGSGKKFQWKAPKGNWAVYTYTIEESNNGSVNYLSNKLMDVFIPIAHESYENSVGDFMGNVIPGVFVDNEGDYGFKMAWSEYLGQRYLEMKGTDVRKYLPLLTEKDKEGYWVKARYDWFDVVSDIYTNQFIGTLNDWLQKKDMYYISNLWEESLLLQTQQVGDFMRSQRRVTMPGNDCLLMYSQNVHDFKETQSVCEFEDRPFMSELMGVAGWQQTPSQMKMTLNAVTAWGVTHTVPHGINLNRKLETIPYPADWFTENPFWRYLNHWTDFARRSSFVNRQGQLVADVLLYNPLESIWALSEGYFTSPAGDEWPEKAIEINNNYSGAMDILTKSWLDYLIGDTHYLNKAIVLKDKKTGIKLKIGTHEFSVLVLPPLFVISQSASQKILKFAQAGGTVIFLGDLPQGSPQVGLIDPQIKSDMKKLIELSSVVNLSKDPDKIKNLPNKIKNLIEPQVINEKGNTPLLISHRQIENKHFYWIANNQGISQEITLSLRDGSGTCEIWNCETGDIQPITYKRSKNRNIVDLKLNEYEGFWMVFDESEKVEKQKKIKPTSKISISLNEPWKINYPETDRIELTSVKSHIVTDNSIHQEFTKTEFDDSDWTYLNLVGNIRFKGEWKASMFYNPDPDSERYYRYSFNLSDLSNGAIVHINGDNLVELWVNGTKIKSGKNATSWSQYDSYDIHALLKNGKNVIAVKETNRAGYGWMVVQGLIQLKTGEEIELLTNSEWKETDKLISNWQNLNFNDSSWSVPILADEKVSTFNFFRMRPPDKILFSKSTAWWRIPIIPNAKYLMLPGLDKNAEIWIDGSKVNIHNEKLIIPDKAIIIVIKNGEGADGLTEPAYFYCEGQSETPLISWADLGLRRFTGFVDYETTIDIPTKTTRVTIDLGKVNYMAEVWVNGEKIGERLWAPFTFSSKAFKPGKNKLRVRIGNLMVNKMAGEDDLGKLRTWGWSNPPQESFESGLLGPVIISIIKK